MSSFIPEASSTAPAVRLQAPNHADLRANLSELRALAQTAEQQNDVDAIRDALNRVRLSAINAVELCNRIEFEARLQAISQLEKEPA